MKKAFLYVLGSLIGTMCLALSSHAANGDLYVAVSQSTVDKVLNDAHFPLVVVDNWWPDCCSNEFDSLSVPYTAANNTQLIAWARAHTESAGNDGDVAKAITLTEDAAIGELDRTLALIKTAETSHQKWQGPSAADINAIRAKGIQFRPYLKHIKVAIRNRPGISISGDPISVSNLNVAVDATGQLYAYVLQFKCTKYFGPICIGGDFYWGWTRAAEASVSDIRITADAALHPVINKLAINLVPEVKKLRLDYPILRDIPIENWVNPIVSQHPFQAVDASALVEAIPYVDENYVVKALRISGTNELRLDIDVGKK